MNSFKKAIKTSGMTLCQCCTADNITRIVVARNGVTDTGCYALNTLLFGNPTGYR